MLTSANKEIATRATRKALPPPAIRANLDFVESYSASEFELIKRGLIPEGMKDKWFVFFEEPWLYFHTGWTGASIFGLRFQHSTSGVSVVESWASRDSKAWGVKNADYEKVLLKFLIDVFLLGKSAYFPVPSNLPRDVPKGLYQHAMIGRAFQETIYPAGPPATRPLWYRFRQLLRKRWDW